MSDTIAMPTQMADEKFTPTIYIDLTKSDVKELSGVKAGDRVRVVITGRIKEITTRDGDGRRTGSIAVESKDVIIRPQPEGSDIFDELADDD